ncbi:Multidrug resistance protein NorM [Marinomonas gallaica]|uniref:Multidrug-efflux transporter n=1 Tax=Marinomonas gallaica TaxID=1806667 RepID=A0A1C3JMJ3_9GAMM|nr:MATE family efflux transporter [Marinomonas gallaica]SBT16433.1 Multidrug resistance protein NorM [Marinomonas gallaica]SBT21481.1 Multidrug resistance protein NorM [Marinomonas gallaica]
MFKRFTKRYPSLSEILHLLFPMILTMTLELSISIVDTMMLGHYDSLHLAAVGLASSLWSPVACFMIGVTFGLTPLITRHLHGRQRLLVNVYMSQAFGLSIILGLIGAIMSITVLPMAAKMMASEPETQRVAAQYLYLFSPTFMALALMTSYKNLFEAAGKPRVPLLVATLSLILNIVFNYVLIYGKLGFPEMGASGAAIASASSVWLSLIVFVLYDLKVNPDTLFNRIDWYYVRHFGILFGVGMPAGFAFAFEIGLFSSLTWLISAFGDLALGAGQIVMSYSTILFTPLMAMSAVTAIVVAKAMATDGIEEVQRRIRIILALGAGYVAICFTLTQALHEQIPLLFSSNEVVAAMAAGILLISSSYQLPDMVQTVFTGALRGLRDTRSSMIAMAISLFGLSIPLGYWLSHYSPWAETLHVRGLYVGLGFGLLILATILTARYRLTLKKFRNKKLPHPEEVA